MKFSTTFLIHRSHFSKFVNGFSFCVKFGCFRDVSFNMFLNSALEFNSMEIFSNKSYDTQQVYRDNQIFIHHCTFMKCQSVRGGAIAGTQINFTVTDCVFSGNRAKVGGAVLVNRTTFVYYERILFFNNSAEYSASSHTDSHSESNNSYLNLVNVSYNHADKWTGGLRIDRAGGNMTNCCFVFNNAVAAGGFFDFSWNPSRRNVFFCLFMNNTARSRGAAYTCSHIMECTRIENCVFIRNFCEMQVHSISVETIDQNITVSTCLFDGPKEKHIAMRYGRSYLVIENCQFDADPSILHKNELEIINRIAQNPPIIKQNDIYLYFGLEADTMF